MCAERLETGRWGKRERERGKYKRGHQNSEVKLQGKEENGKGEKAKGNECYKEKEGASKMYNERVKWKLRKTA